MALAFYTSLSLSSSACIFVVMFSLPSRILKISGTSAAQRRLQKPFALWRFTPANIFAVFLLEDSPCDGDPPLISSTNMDRNVLTNISFALESVDAVADAHTLSPCPVGTLGGT